MSQRNSKSDQPNNSEQPQRQSPSHLLDRVPSFFLSPTQIRLLYQKVALGGKWVTLSYGLALVLLGIVGVLSQRNTTQLTENAAQVTQTQATVKKLEQLSQALTKADYHRRGYYLYSDLVELDLYRSTTQNIQTLLPKLQPLVSYTPVQQQRFDRLEQIMTRRIQFTEQSIAQFEFTKTSPIADDPLVLEIIQMRHEVQQIIRTIVDEEEALLQIRLAQAQTTLQRQIMIETVGSVLIISILIAVYRLLYYQKTRREQAEIQQRILASGKALSEMKLAFFSTVSHEFHAPLSLILESAQQLEETLRSVVEPANLKNLYRVQSSTHLMTQMLTDLLTIAKANAGKLDYRPTQVELQPFCLNLVETFQVYGGVRRSIQFVQRGVVSHAQLDEKLMHTVLSNLLSNALKYSPPEQPVEFILMERSAIEQPNAIIFQIRDRGIGIAPDDLAQLFEPFQRGQNAEEFIGSGLGLALVKKCLDLHQGQITIDSQVGAGTTVTIEIPQEI